MSDKVEGARSDVDALAARVDELMVVVAALARVIERGTHPALGIRVDRLSEAEIMNALKSVAADLDDLRFWVAALHERTDQAEVTSALPLTKLAMAEETRMIRTSGVGSGPFSPRLTT